MSQNMLPQADNLPLAATSGGAISPPAVDRLTQRLQSEAESAGYHLNPDVEFTKALVHSLLINEERYGYPACPCRLAEGEKEEDLDIICPCDYRDPDLEEFGMCFCCLYVDEATAKGEKETHSIPERRLPIKERAKLQKPTETPLPQQLSYPVWRCKVCGYLCARDEPPGICPICKVSKERFERFL
ncbi:MAG: ferredoxin-thioredoxin reductase catalytic domain-containing protein [bacterium]|jgi:ferredoxin-thioredoxin reductase catalytic subunit